MNMELGDQIADLLCEAYGPLPSLRPDTPLSALNFQPADAVVLCYLAKQHDFCVPTDSEFSTVVTVGDLSEILMGVPSGGANA